MSEKELITVTIDNYMNLQRIKKANGDRENIELDYQLKGLVAKLSSFGVHLTASVCRRQSVQPGAACQV